MTNPPPRLVCSHCFYWSEGLCSNSKTNELIGECDSVYVRIAVAADFGCIFHSYLETNPHLLDSLTKPPKEPPPMD